MGTSSRANQPPVWKNLFMSSAQIRVMLADDHPIVRHGLRALLESRPGYEVVAEASDGESAVREAVINNPDVILMDLAMPVTDGIAATRRIREACPATAVLVLTMSNDDDTLASALRAGAHGYLLKGAGQDEIDRAIRAVVAGEAIFGHEVAERVIGRAGRPAAGETVPPFPELTDREREILDRVAVGHRNAAIALELSLSPKTVANHLSSVFAKLGVDGRMGAIIRAREQGLGR